MKLLITHNTITPSMDGPTHLPGNSLADVERDNAQALVQAGKALYIDAKDDPTTRGNAPGRWTASEAQVAAVRDALRVRSDKKGAAQAAA